MPVVAKRHRNRNRTDGDGDSESECAPSRSASKSEPEDVAMSDVGEFSARSQPAAASVREKKNALEDAGVDLSNVIERNDLEAKYTALMAERAKKPSANANAKRAKKNDAFDTKAAPALASPNAKKERAAKVLEYGVDIVDAYRTLGNSSTWDKYASMKADEVKSWLKANNMRHSGTKELNVARCVDGETWGALPGCPRCRAGKLRVRYPSADAAVHDGKGTWTCGGFFDDALGLHQNCYFSADGSDEVVRERWRTKHDPAPKFGSAAAAGSNANANVDARADFVSGFAVLHRSAAAVELLCVARRLKFQLPVDDQQAKVLCLTKLMATKDFEEGVWDGDAALSALREEHAPLMKTELSGGPPARCEKNSALASALDRLARLEKNAGGDAFKIRSYVAAASEIRALDRVVDSGKACAKSGPTKVKGIGKGIAEKIDDFLVSGTMQRILELESGAVA